MIYTNADNVLFMSSSGHCSLDCTYCVASPVVKREASLSYEDIAYILETLPGKTALIFSGKGDFFAGYRKNDRLLSNVLDHNVDVALDINGVMIHEFPDLPNEKLEKIKAINLTMHYSQLVRKRALAVWSANARTIISRQRCVDFVLGFIVTPAEHNIWPEALSFFEKEIFDSTGTRLSLIRDVLNVFDREQEECLETLSEKYNGLIKDTRTEDFAAPFSQFPYVVCPAGRNYFRVWNDGKIEGCPYVAELKDCGNAKNRVLHRNDSSFRCQTASFCDCYTIAALGKMEYPDIHSS